MDYCNNINIINEMIVNKFSDDFNIQIDISDQILKLYENITLDLKTENKVILFNRQFNYKEFISEIKLYEKQLTNKEGINRNLFLFTLLDKNSLFYMFYAIENNISIQILNIKASTDELIKFIKDTNINLVLYSSKYDFNKYYHLLDLSTEYGNELINTGIPDTIVNLDSIQFPDRSLINYNKYLNYIGQAMVKNSISVQFSRGCKYNCAYCMKTVLSSYRNRSAENMFSEIEHYYKIGFKRFAFIDDLPNFNVKESIRLFKYIIDSKIEIQLFFPNGLRGDILNKEYIDYMIEAGTVNLDFALETASDRLQKLINKNLNVDKLYENIEYILEYYPHVILELQALIGIPTETKEEALKSLEFIKSLHWIDFPYMHILKIYPNTPMADLALKNGISLEQINKSDFLGYHELPDTLPFSKTFSKRCQSDLLVNYFLNRDRILSVLPKQANILTKNEIILKYNSYLPMQIDSINDILTFSNIREDEINLQFIDDEYGKVKHVNDKLNDMFIKKPLTCNKPYRVLFLDLTMFFEDTTDKIYNVVEPPIGLLYILTNLNKLLGDKIKGKIYKSGVDFTSFEGLFQIIKDFKPDFIGIRSMNYYKYFFHITAALIRQWGFDGIITAGGPYATSSYNSVLNDYNIDFALIGEGEYSTYVLLDYLIKLKKGEIDISKINDIHGLVYRKEKKSKNQFEIFIIDENNAINLN